MKVILGSIGDPVDPSELEVTIEDSGIGMTPEQMSRIFEPFTQADTSTTRKYGGTGLGLSISKRLAEALNGSLAVNSEFGQGTRVVLRLAIQLPDSSRILSPQEAMSYVSRTRPDEFKKVDLCGIRVLVVDDGDTNRDLLTLLLNDAGAEVISAANGLEAVQLLTDQNQFVDVVLMDMQMPVMDGYTAARELRAKGFARPVIAMTANAMVGDDARCRESGCSDYLSKPINLDRLLELVRHWAEASTCVERVSDVATMPSSDAGSDSPWKR